MRWIISLFDFNYEVVYIKASKNIAADAISRMYEVVYIHKKDNEICIDAVIKDTNNKELINALKDIENLQKWNVYISEIIKKLKYGINKNINNKYIIKNKLLMNHK